MLRSIRRAGITGAIRMHLESQFGAGRDVKLYDEKLRSIASRAAVKELGRGKDGVTLLLNYPDGNCIVQKVLSDYGWLFYPRTKAAIAKLSNQNEFYSLDENEFGYSYEWEPLFPVCTLPNQFLETVSQICKLQSDLIKFGFTYWDLGGLHTNYLLNANGRIKIIDYGGNSFLPIQDFLPKRNLKSWRKNILNWNDSFIRTELHLHIVSMLFHDQSAIKLGIWCQFSAKAIEIADKLIRNSLHDNLREDIYQAIQILRPTSSDSWLELMCFFSEASKRVYRVADFQCYTTQKLIR